MRCFGVTVILIVVCFASSSSGKPPDAEYVSVISGREEPLVPGYITCNPSARIHPDSSESGSGPDVVVAFEFETVGPEGILEPKAEYTAAISEDPCMDLPATVSY